MGDTKTILPCPKVGETFILSINGDDERNHPDAMARRSGDSRKLSHDGPLVMGRVTRNLKLVETDSARLSFAGIISELARYGRIPCGQWCLSFMAAYRTDAKRLVGIADASWEDPRGNRLFPYFNREGKLRFHSTDGIFDKESRLWIVAVNGQR